MYYIKDTIQNKTMGDSIKFFSEIYFLYGIETKFTYKKFENFISNLYDIYQFRGEIYKYREDVRLFLGNALIITIMEGRTNITIENILDSIWDIKSKAEVGSNLSFNNSKASCNLCMIKNYRRG